MLVKVSAQGLEASIPPMEIAIKPWARFSRWRPFWQAPQLGKERRRRRGQANRNPARLTA